MSGQVLLDPDDLNVAARACDAARSRLDGIGSYGFTLLPDMPPDLTGRVRAFASESMGDVRQMSSYLGEEADELRGTARKAVALDQGGGRVHLPAGLAARLTPGPVQALSLTFSVPKVASAGPRTVPELSWNQKLGRAMFSLGAKPIDEATFGLFGKGIDAVGLEEVYDPNGVTAKIGGYGSYALGAAGLAKLGKKGLRKLDDDLLRRKTDEVRNTPYKKRVEIRTERQLRNRSRQLLGDKDRIPVLGRQPDTDVAKDWPGHVILATDDWTEPLNTAWVKEIAAQGRKVYVGSPEANNMIITKKGPYFGEPTIFAKEMDQLTKVGYKRRGDYLIPPR